MYRIEFANAPAKELARLYQRDKKLYQRFCTVIDSLKENPFSGKKLKGPLVNDYSIRLGDYRIVYTVLKERLLIYIIDLGHRRDIYQ